MFRTNGDYRTNGIVTPDNQVSNRGTLLTHRNQGAGSAVKHSETPGMRLTAGLKKALPWFAERIVWMKSASGDSFSR